MIRRFFVPLTAIVLVAGGLRCRIRRWRAERGPGFVKVFVLVVGVSGCGSNDPYDIISTGMTETEVRLRLGNLPQKVESQGSQDVIFDARTGRKTGTRTDISKRIDYEDKANNRVIMVWFENGKVTKKEKSK